MKKKILIIGFVLVFSLILSVILFNQSENITSKVINTKENLPAKDIKEIYKDNLTLKIVKRVDMGHEFLIDVIEHNNRLYYYDLYIKLAKERGYKVTSYVDYIENYKDTNQKVLILRHDIDVINEGTNKMFEIEKRNNVKATYYFRWETFNKKLIDDLNTSGFEVGLHYETIATYCDKYNKKNLNKYDLGRCRGELKQEIRNFKSKSGINIKTIASHGANTNIRIKIPNNILFEGENYSDYGIISETYDKVILKKYITTYISDGYLYNNFGFKYTNNPIDAIVKDDKVIEFLSHPSHWNFSPAEIANILKKINSYKI